MNNLFETASIVLFNSYNY